MKYLILGGNGFIGTEIAKKLSTDNQNDITILDKKINNKPKYKFICGDLTSINPSKLPNDFDVIINCASILGINNVMSHPYETLLINSKCAETGLKIAFNQANLYKYVYFSSSEIYGTHALGKTEEAPFIIESSKETRWSYATSKVFGEQLTFAAAKKLKIPVLVIRPFNIYGTTRGKSGAINSLLHEAIEKHQVTITGNGEQKRAWCYISDFVNALLICINNCNENEVFNIGNSNEIYSINQIVDLIENIIQIKLKRKYISLSEDVITRSPDITKVQKIGYYPRVSLECGIKAILKDIDYEIKSKRL